MEREMHWYKFEINGKIIRVGGWSYYDAQQRAIKISKGL